MSLILSGNSCSWTKIKDEDLPKIKEMFEVLGLSQTTIARKFKVSQGQISKILNGRRRK